MMKKILFVLWMLAMMMSANAQVKQIYPQYGGTWKRLQVDSAFKIPMRIVGIKDANAGYDTAQIRYSAADSSVYVYTGSQWIKILGNVAPAPGDSTLVYWANRGNTFGVIPSGYGLGTNNANHLPFKTNNITRMILPDTGLARQSGGSWKALMFDTSGKALGYGDIAGGSTNSNVGSGYRLAIPLTNNIKTLGGGYGITLDSATSNQIGFKLDSATVSSYFLRRKDSATGTNLNGYLTRSYYSFSNGLTQSPAGTVKFGGTLTANTDLDMGGGWLLRFYESAPRYISYDGWDFNMRTTSKMDIRATSGSNTSQLYVDGVEGFLYSENTLYGTTAKVRSNQDLAESYVTAPYPGGNDQASVRADYNLITNSLSAGVVIHPVSSINYGFFVDRNTHMEYMGIATGINNNFYRGVRVDSTGRVEIDTLYHSPRTDLSFVLYDSATNKTYSTPMSAITGSAQHFGIEDNSITTSRSVTFDGGSFSWVGMASFADTTNWKPIVINTSTGEMRKATYWPGSGGGSGLTVGTTAISSGTSNRILYENSSHVLTEASGLSYDGANVIITASGGLGTGLTITSTSASSYSSLNFITTTGGTGYQIGTYGPGAAAADAAFFYNPNNSPQIFFNNNAEKMRLSGAGNLLIGGSADPASATTSLVLFNGTAPSASVTDGIALYAQDVAASSELKVRDEAGNITTISPHNFTGIPIGRSGPLAWSYYSEKDGRYINVDMLKAIRTIEDLSKRVAELETKNNIPAKKPVKLVYTGRVNNKPNKTNK
jgi:hypothetical protein